MSYKAIYRTYRPQTFDEVVGQKAIIQTIQNALIEEKISHAYLFCGPHGTGKTTMAKLLAKAINCENGLCDECESCKAIALGSHPDVIEIDAASNNSVEDIRELIEKIKYAPLQSKYKVYIIDEVHMMSTSAFNAFLKTLEEPPGHVIFILATTDPQKVLPTIISRCQRFDFTNLTIKDIKERLVTILEEEAVKFEEKAIDLIAKLANGGMRDALGILEQALAYQPEELSIATISEVYGIATMDVKIALANNIINTNIKDLMEELKIIFSKGIDIRLLTNDLIDIFKDLIIYNTTNESTLLSVCSIEDINQLSIEGTNEVLFKNIDILLDTLQRYKHTSSINLYFELACLKMATKKEDKVIQSNLIKDDVTLPNVSLPMLNEQEGLYSPSSQSEQKNDSVKEIEIKFTRQMSVDKDEILNVLVQANKIKRSEIENIWNMIYNYASTLSFAKPALLLEDFKVVAAANNAIVVTNANQAACNRINDKDNQFEVIALLRELYKNDYLVYAVNDVDWKQILQEFISLQKSGNLPVAKPIIIPVKEVAKEDDIEDFTKDLFKDSVEIEIEENMEE